MLKLSLTITGTNLSTSADEYTVLDHTLTFPDDSRFVEGFINVTTTAGKINLSQFSSATALQAIFQNIGSNTVTINFRDYTSTARSVQLLAGGLVVLPYIVGVVTDECITMTTSASESVIKYIMAGSV